MDAAGDALTMLAEGDPEAESVLLGDALRDATAARVTELALLAVASCVPAIETAGEALTMLAVPHGDAESDPVRDGEAVRLWLTESVAVRDAVKLDVGVELGDGGTGGRKTSMASADGGSTPSCPLELSPQQYVPDGCDAHRKSACDPHTFV